MEIKYDKIGIGYNTTRKADPFLLDRLYFFLNPKSGQMYLDVGCGTGNYTCSLADRGVQFTGLDPSEKMLNEAREKNPKLNWVLGTAEQIPFEDKTFAGAIATLTIHHWTDLTKSFKEISRVLTDEGRLVIFTSTPQQMKGYWLNHYFPEMLRASIIQMPSLELIHEALNNSGLKISAQEKYFIKDDLQDSFLQVGKNNPEYYFDERIRAGISSFSALGNISEVIEGLTKLRNDIDDGTFERIRQEYESEEGDYLFLRIDKTK